MGMKSKSAHFGSGSGGPSVRQGLAFKLNTQLFASMPKGASQIKHIMAKREGHIEDSTCNRKMLEKVSSKKANFIKTDPRGFNIYSEIVGGKEYWVYERGGIIQDGGANLPGKFRFHNEDKKGGKK